jgi:hypothetical protein
VREKPEKESRKWRKERSFLLYHPRHSQCGGRFMDADEKCMNAITWKGLRWSVGQLWMEFRPEEDKKSLPGKVLCGSPSSLCT